MSSHQRNVMVGAVVLVGLGMLAWMVLQFANKAASYFLTTGTRITLRTDHAEGVGEGSPVTFKGVYVGRVTKVTRAGHVSEDHDKNDVILIEALIEANPPLPANLRGKIRQASLLGASSTISLEYDPKAIDRLSMTGRQQITEGTQLEAEYVPGITELGDDIRALTGRMQDTVNSINAVIGDSKVQDDIKVSLASARTTLESAQRIAIKLEQISGTIDKTANNANETIGEVRVTVKDARGEIKRMGDNLNQRIDQMADSLQHVQSITRKIDDGEGTAGALVNDPKLYESLADTASELNLMVKDMRRLIQQWEQEGIVKF